MTMVRVAACALLWTALVCAEPVHYAISPGEGTHFTLELYKTGLMSGKKHVFVFEAYGGQIVYDPEAVGNSRVRLVVDAASVACQDTWVSDKQLRDIQKYTVEEMLRVSEQPAIVFESQSVTPAGEGQFVVSGLLSIRGVNKPVEVSLTMMPEEGDALRFSGSSEVDLRHYGIKPKKAALGMIGTKSVMTVSFELVAKPTPK